MDRDTPWIATPSSDGSVVFIGPSSSDLRTCLSRTDADFILHRLNCYDDLVLALDAMNRAFEPIAKAIAAEGTEGTFEQQQQIYACALSSAALAKAMSVAA